MAGRWLGMTLCAAVVLAGCGDDGGGTDAGPPADAGPTDAGGDDAGGDDAGTATDAGSDDAATGDTWSSWAQGFFADYCTECHSGGDRDYTTIDHVQRDADTIRCGVSPEMLDGCGSWPPPAQFPVGDGPKPSDEERRRLVAWIDAGLAE